MKWPSIQHWKHRFARPTLAQALRKQAAHSGDIDLSATAAPVLVISHDLFPAGAQQVLLDLLRQWHSRQPFPVKVISVGDGALRKHFEGLYPMLVLSDHKSARLRDAALVEFIAGPVRAIYSNTVVNGPLLGDLRELCVPIITHCHELQSSIERWAAGATMAATLANSDLFLAASHSIADNLRRRHSVPAERLDVVLAFIEFWETDRRPAQAELDAMRRELGLQGHETIVFGCGTTDWRKGPDLFLRTAIQACAQDASLKFVWIGGDESPRQLMQEVSAAGLEGRIRFIGMRPSARNYFYVGHIFALTSREDPCPLVALEAANARLPVICFDGAGDIPRVLGAESGAVVPYEDCESFANVILGLARNPQQRLVAGDIGYEQVRLNHSAPSAAQVVADAITKVQRLPFKKLGRCQAPLVSVVIPSYNHRRFLEERLRSVAGQSLRHLEIIILDDASNDGSQEVLRKFAAGDSRATLILNDLNSGSTFKQWRKGLAAAQGKYIWIAESDDVADHRLLKTAVDRMESDSQIVVTHVQSMMVDVDGRRLGKPMDWVNDVARGRWDDDFIRNGLTEVRECLSQKNTIPNASAVIFRNFPGIENLVDDTMRLCADWLFWIRLLARGKYAFVAEDLNKWRQSSSNARTRPPGVLEWQEGQRILQETGQLLSLSDTDTRRMIERFRERCLEWSGGRLED